MNTFKLHRNDVRADELKNVIVDRRYPNPKIKLGQTPSHIGVLRVNVISGPSYVENVVTWHSFPHFYNYTPTVIGMFFESEGDFSNGGILPYAGFGAIGEIFMDADDENINVKFQSSLGGSLPVRRFFIRYYVFAETGQGSAT